MKPRTRLKMFSLTKKRFKMQKRLLGLTFQATTKSKKLLIQSKKLPSQPRTQLSTLEKKLENMENMLKMPTKVPKRLLSMSKKQL